MTAMNLLEMVTVDYEDYYIYLKEISWLYEDYDSSLLC